MIPNLLSSPDFLAALQDTYGNGFYNSQNHEHYDPQDPDFAIHANYQPSMPLHNGNMYIQPAEPSDLAVLENLKATIKGQHPLFRPEPRSAGISALWQGAHPDSGLQEPTHDKGKGPEQPDGPTNEISVAAPSPSQWLGFSRLCLFKYYSPASVVCFDLQAAFLFVSDPKKRRQAVTNCVNSAPPTSPVGCPLSW